MPRASIAAESRKTNENVKRFLGALGEIAAREGDRLLWVLGIDMAHMGGDMAMSSRLWPMRTKCWPWAAATASAWSAWRPATLPGFWELVQENHDDLKWCGSSPVYTFLKVMPNARGSIERYEQWNIDPQSVVSFAGMSFR